VASNSGSIIVNGIIYGLPNLATDQSKKVVEYPSSPGELCAVLRKINSSGKSIACATSHFTELDPQLSNRSTKKVYALRDGEVIWPKNLARHKIKLFDDEEQLKVDFFLQSMLSFVNEAIKFEKTGDNSLANQCYQTALETLACVHQS
jgi:hypothetical protein